MVSFTFVSTLTHLLLKNSTEQTSVTDLQKLLDFTLNQRLQLRTRFIIILDLKHSNLNDKQTKFNIKLAVVVKNRKAEFRSQKVLFI